jgi:branched-chain amino acid transport system substrate-binding protein
MAGRKIEFISAETGGSPTGATNEAQELIERDRVNVIIGPFANFRLFGDSRFCTRQCNTPGWLGKRAGRAHSLRI